MQRFHCDNSEIALADVVRPNTELAGKREIFRRKFHILYRFQLSACSIRPSVQRRTIVTRGARTFRVRAAGTISNLIWRCRRARRVPDRASNRPNRI
jgi:hypothetical protein